MQISVDMADEVYILIAGDNMKQWLSIDEVAAFFGVTKRTVYNYIHQGLIHYKSGATPVFDPRDVEKWAQPKKIQRSNK